MRKYQSELKLYLRNVLLTARRAWLHPGADGLCNAHDPALLFRP